MDEDEVEFLDSVLESTRAKEEAVKKETSEQLELFRRQREEADRVQLNNAGAPGAGSASPVEEESWATSKKRRRGKEKEALKGIKLKRTSSTGEDKATPRTTEAATETARSVQKDGSGSPVATVPRRSDKDQVAKSSSPPSKPPESKASALGLGDYSSDED